MNDWTGFLYVFSCGAMLMMSILGFESAYFNPSLNRWIKTFFCTFFAVLFFGAITFFLELVVYFNPSWVLVLTVTYFFQSVLYAVPFPMIAVFLLHSCEEDWKQSSLFRITMVLFGVYFILLIVSQFTTLFCYVTPESELVLGPAYPLLIVPMIAMLITVIAGVIRRRNKLSRRYLRAFLIALLPVSIAIFIHMFVPVFTLIDIALTLSAYSMYRLIVFDSIERDLRQQEEIAQQRANIAVLQMRPHFIYNTMTSIYYLCDQNPQVAKQVTMDFSTYLRKNLAAIASEDTIPFSEELEHARAYLAVEQAQFEDDLVVSFDTPHVRFRVPPLTLQPLVENAVKHGMDLDSVPLHVLVRTAKTAKGSEVIVEDDGPGFDTTIADDPKTTLANIRQRVSLMCSGTLEITPREAGGTVVRVRIPDKDEQRRE